MKCPVSKESIIEFLIESIKELTDKNYGCECLRLTTQLGICVGWTTCYDSDDLSVIHASDSNDWTLCAGIKVYSSCSPLVEYDDVNNIYEEENPEDCYADDNPIDVEWENEEQLDELADMFIDDFEDWSSFVIDDDGAIQRGTEND